AWVGPVLVETTCAPVAEFVQNFDLQNGANILPTCWRQIGSTGAIAITQTVSPSPPPSSPNSFKIDGQLNQPTIVALPPLSTAQSGTHRLRVKVRGNVAGVKLEVGYL